MFSISSKMKLNLFVRRAEKNINVCLSLSQTVHSNLAVAANSSKQKPAVKAGFMDVGPVRMHRP